MFTYAQLAATFPIGIRHFLAWIPSRIRNFFSGITGFFLWNPVILESILEIRNPGREKTLLGKNITQKDTSVLTEVTSVCKM